MAQTLENHGAGGETRATTALPPSLSAAVQRIRGTFTELFVALRIDPATPREAARRLGVNKNLTWKVSKIIGATNAATLVQHLPGPSGLDILVAACERAGAPATCTKAVRVALTKFDELVAVHADDRATLLLMLDSMTTGDRADAERQEAARKRSFEGNSVTWGVQARVRTSTHVIAPNHDDPDLIDAAMIVGLIDLRRLRPAAPWPLFRRRDYNDDGTPIEIQEEPIDPRSSPAVPIMRDYSSKPLIDVQAITCGGETFFELPPGPIGRTGAVTCIIGQCARRFASRYRDDLNVFGEHTTHVATPVEYLMTDVLLHNDLGIGPPRACLYSLLTTKAPYPRFGRDRNLLQISEEVQELGTSPPVVATPLVADYPRLVQTAYDHLGWPAEDFTGYRFVMRYPAIPTLLVLRSDLPKRPE